MKDNLPYFSHDNNARRHPKMKALIAEFGFEGYGRFWALNERIAESSNACIDISKKVNKLDLANELGLDGNGLDRFIAFLSDPEIDLINVQNNKITTDRTNEDYSKMVEKRTRQRKRKTENKEIVNENAKIDSENEEIDSDFDTEENRIEQNRTEENKQDSIGSDEPPEKTTSKPAKPKKLPLRQREPVNDMEKVEKAYLQNWDILYSQKRVKKEDPLVNWNQTKALLKNLLKKLKPEEIIKALNLGMKDDFCVSSGYSLATMLAANVLNRLINSAKATPAGLEEKKSLSGLNSIFGGQ